MIKTKLLAAIAVSLIAWTAGSCEDSGPSIGELRRMCSDALKKKDFHKTRELALFLRERTSAEKDERSLGYADCYLGASEIFLGDPDSGLEHLKEARDIAEKYDNDTLLGGALNGLAIYEANVNSNYYLAQHYLMQCLDCPNMEGSASTNLAQIALLQNDTSGMEYARRAYNYGVRTEEVHYSYSSLQNLVEFAIMKGDFEEASSYLEQLKEIANKYSYKDKEMILLHEAMILAHMGNFMKSNEILREIRHSIETKLPIYFPELLFLMGENYNNEGKFAESNAILSQAIKATRNASFSSSLVKIYRLMADNYSSMKLDSESLKYLRQAFELLEKSAQTDRERMVNERRLLLEVIDREKKRQLAEEMARHSKHVAVFLGIMLILALAIIIMVIVTLRRRDHLYRHIVQQNLAMLESEKKYEERIRELETNYEAACGAKETLNGQIASPDHVAPATTTVPGDTGEENKSASGSVLSGHRSRSLFESLQNLMERDELYRQPLLTRETVMDMLKTNPTYLSLAIKENAGMNYSQYVNSFRIREALKALSDREQLDVPIKDIASKAGFNSISTFYKLFQQTTGISPVAYRRSLAGIV